MEQTAAPGTVQIADDTYRLVKPLFEFEELGGIEVKGKAEPVLAYRVLARKAAPGALRGIEGLHADMVGREAELARAARRAGRAAAGRGPHRVRAGRGRPGQEPPDQRDCATLPTGRGAEGRLVRDRQPIVTNPARPTGCSSACCATWRASRSTTPAICHARKSPGTARPARPNGTSAQAKQIFAALFSAASERGGRRWKAKRSSANCSTVMRDLWRERIRPAPDRAGVRRHALDATRLRSELLLPPAAADRRNSGGAAVRVSPGSGSASLAPEDRGRRRVPPPLYRGDFAAAVGARKRRIGRSPAGRGRTARPAARRHPGEGRGQPVLHRRGGALADRQRRCGRRAARRERPAPKHSGGPPATRPSSTSPTICSLC